MQSSVLPYDDVSDLSLSDKLHRTFSRLWEDNITILRTIIEESEDVIFAKDREGRYLIINSVGAKSAGKTIDEMVGLTDLEIFPKSLARELRANDLKVMDSGHTHYFENVITIGKSARVFHSIKSPYRDEAGNIKGVIAIARDITGLKQAEIAHALLAKIGEVLSTSLDYEVRLNKLAELAVPQLADWCAVDILQEDGLFQRVAVTHVDATKVELARFLHEQYPLDWDKQSGPAEVLRTGQSILYSEITEDMLREGIRDKHYLQLLLDLRLRSLMLIPLTARGKTFGVMTFIWAESHRYYNESDLALAEEIARRAAVAVDNARLYQAERDARQRAELTAQRISSMQLITAALSESITPLEVAKVVVEQGMKVMQADSCVVTLLDEQHNNLEILHFCGYQSASVKQWHCFSLSSPVPAAETVQKGEPIFFETLDSLPKIYPGAWAEDCIRHHSSLAALPLVVEGRTIGSIVLSFDKPHRFSEETGEFLMGIARQCAQALERARLYQAEKESRAKAEAAHQHLATVAEIKERNRLAQELHDTVAQALGYLNLKMSMALMMLDQGHVEEIRENLHELKQIIGETYTDVREEIFNLRSIGVTGIDFLDTLQDYVSKYKRFYALDVQLVKNENTIAFDFPDEVGIQLIRTIQEALINIRKHARVDEAVIYLDEENDGVRIRIEDKGRGFERGKTAESSTSKFGLKIMQERIEKIGGRLEISSTPGHGTQITLFYKANSV
ncbi:MAG: GAF domain-containing protein [Anaerolineae bacterium]|nr:GAF domain-containing protein [Anaerolineae bacterium]